MEPDAIELRVLGCLIEKQRTTPDAYPLSLNALRLACNQSTNRDPVVDYDEATIREALNRLYRRRWTRLTSSQGSRAAKYRHLLGEELGLGPDELALLAVLLLRGPQTPGELHARVARLHAFASMDEIGASLGRLVDRAFVERVARRPGQKEDRYVQRLGDAGERADAPSSAPPAAGEGADAPSSAPPATAQEGPAAAGAPLDPGPATDDGDGDGGERRLAALERDLAALRAEVSELRRALGG